MSRRQETEAEREKQPQRGLSSLFLPPPPTKATAGREPARQQLQVPGKEAMVLGLDVESGHPALSYPHGTFGKSLPDWCFPQGLLHVPAQS